MAMAFPMLQQSVVVSQLQACSCIFISITATAACAILSIPLWGFRRELLQLETSIMTARWTWSSDATIISSSAMSPFLSVMAMAHLKIRLTSPPVATLRWVTLTMMAFWILPVCRIYSSETVMVHSDN